MANGINNEGQIVGYYFTGSGDPRVVEHAFVLSGGTRKVNKNPVPEVVAFSGRERLFWWSFSGFSGRSR